MLWLNQWYNRSKSYWPYALLAGIIMLPLLRPGYILAVDMVFVPHMPTPVAFSNDYLFFGLLHVLSYVMPAMILQKIILVGIFVAAGMGAHRLMATLRPASVKSAEWRWACYFGGLLYACNPFVYTRLLAGQYALLLGYAFLPWLVAAVWRLCRQPGRAGALRVIVFTLLVSIVSLHMLGIGIIVALLMVLGQAWQQRHHTAWRQAMAKQGALVVGIILAASSYWLLPLLAGHSHTATTIASFGNGDLQAFQTVPGHLGLAGSVLALQGFWGDAHNLYLLPQDNSSWWWMPIVLLWVLVAAGMMWSWRRQRRAGLLFAACLLLGLVLAIGTAGTFVAPFNRFLVHQVPFFAGYREPQKFAALIALSYAYFGGVGLVWLRHYLRIGSRQQLAVVLLLLPLACAPYLPWGGAGQLVTTNYPADWYALNARLQQDDISHANVLFLPWHLYMPFSFSNGVLANPAPKFFAVPIVASNNPEIGRATGYATTSTVAAVNRLLPSAAHNPTFAAQLAQHNIRYIVVAKTYDYRAYDYLQHTPGVQRFSQTATLLAYRVNF